MKPLPHHYAVHTSGAPTGYAVLSSAGLPPLHAAPPAEYDGPGDAWSPEHLLLAAVQACFLFTFRAMAARAKVEFTRLELDATGIVDRTEGTTRFTEILLQPTLTVTAGASREQVLQILHKAEKACLISASLSSRLRLEATVRELDTVLNVGSGVEQPTRGI